MKIPNTLICENCDEVIEDKHEEFYNSYNKIRCHEYAMNYYDNIWMDI